MSWVRARSNPTICSARCRRQPMDTCATRVRFQLPSADDEPQQPRRQERAIVRLVRPLFCFDQLARARPATPCPAEAPRSLSARGHATPPRAARTPMCVVRQHARRPPFRLVRGSVADPSADMRAADSSLSSVPYRDPTGLLTGCCCASLRPGVHLSVRSSSSRPSAAAGAFSATSCVSSTAAYAVPRVRNGQAVFSSMAEALARLMPTNGCCSRRKEEC